MAKEVIVYIDKFSTSEERDKCYTCSARGNGYIGNVPFPRCKVAKLEKELGKIPNNEEIKNNKINTNSIPDGCPNGYINPKFQKIRME